MIKANYILKTKDGSNIILSNYTDGPQIELQKISKFLQKHHSIYLNKPHKIATDLIRLEDDLFELIPQVDKHIEYLYTIDAVSEKDNIKFRTDTVKRISKGFLEKTQLDTFTISEAKIFQETIADIKNFY